MPSEHPKLTVFWPAALPLALLGLVPFDIPLSVFYHTLAPWGVANPYWVALAIAGSGLIAGHIYLKHPAFSAYDRYLGISLLLLAGLAVRALLFPFESKDYLGALSMWYDTVAAGGFAALGERGYSDYNSPYLYLMLLLTYLPLPKLAAIKVGSVLFDVLGAWAAYRIARVRYPKGGRAAVAGLAVWWLPTAVLNSALWAQCDMSYTAFLLMAVWAWVSGKHPAFLVLWWAIGLMFKLQAVFFALPLLLIYLNRPTTWPWLAGIPLGVWVVAVLPQWLAGRALPDLALIYFRQVVRYPALTLDAPSVWGFFPGLPFELFYPVSLVVFGLVIFGLALWFRRQKITLTKDNIVYWAFFSALLIPFLLPKMHERYFFAADVLAVVYVCWEWRRWWIAALVVGSSLFSYWPFLFDTDPVPLFLRSGAMLLALWVLVRDYFFIRYKM